MVFQICDLQNFINAAFYRSICGVENSALLKSAYKNGEMIVFVGRHDLVGGKSYENDLQNKGNLSVCRSNCRFEPWKTVAA